jgi:membrane protein implicated in regulation of membrane protease activity
MDAYWIWWVLAAILVGAELMTGTFYLLAVGVALAVGGLAALMGAATPVQLVIAGILSVVGALLAHRWRKGREPPRSPGLDVGQPVTVLGWKDDGRARVAYRGTQWDAELAVPSAPRADTMYIVGTKGSTLVIADHRA